MRYALIASGVAASLFLQACSLTPKYDRPDSPPETAAWPQGDAYQNSGLQGLAAADLGWRSFFHDPALKQLIDVALENNRELRVAALNVEAYRSQYRIQRSELFPSLGAAANGARQRTTADLSPTGAAGISSQYDVGASMAFELDFFGRVRSLSQQALEEYLATDQARRSVHISLVSDVAQAYLAWQADQALLDVARRTLGSNEQTLSLIQSSHDVGVASALEVRQARTAVHDARAYVQRYTRQVAMDETPCVCCWAGRCPRICPPA